MTRFTFSRFQKKILNYAPLFFFLLFLFFNYQFQFSISAFLDGWASIGIHSNYQCLLIDKTDQPPLSNFQFRKAPWLGVRYLSQLHWDLFFLDLQQVLGMLPLPLEFTVKLHTCVKKAGFSCCFPPPLTLRLFLNLFLK